MTDKKLRITELALVILVAFLPSIVTSVYVAITQGTVYRDPRNEALTYLIWVLQASISIMVMFYVLYRQGKRYTNIGLTFSISWKDIGHALVIIFVSRFAQAIVSSTINLVSHDFLKEASNPKNINFLHTNLTFFLVLIMIIVPAQEELIVRGFTMTEIFDMTNNKYWAVIISVGIQFTYHLYQGLPSALILLPYFIISALYFIRFGNLNPVIIAHILTDLSFLLYRR